MHLTYSHKRDLLTLWLGRMPIKGKPARRRVTHVDVFPAVKVYYIARPARHPYKDGGRPFPVDIIALRVQPVTEMGPTFKDYAQGIDNAAGTLVDLRRWLFRFAYDQHQVKSGAQPTDMRELGRVEGRREVATELLERVMPSIKHDGPTVDVDLGELYRDLTGDDPKPRLRLRG